MKFVICMNRVKVYLLRETMQRVRSFSLSNRWLVLSLHGMQHTGIWPVITACSRWRLLNRWLVV